jgi:predicted Zn finger-like uncharacterized protein
MVAPSPESVVIACPACGTRYQLAREMLGKKRMVKCANCQTAWEAFPVEAVAMAAAAAAPAVAEPPQGDQMFTPAEERRLDAAFEAEATAEAASSTPKPIADIVASIAPKPKAKPAADVAVLNKDRQRAFVERQNLMNRRLPLARMRSSARQVALAALIVVFAVVLFFRANIVEQFPDLAGAYSAIGLGVNLVGLEFREVRTLKSLRDGSEVLIVDARIASVSDHLVVVPQVIVTLLDAGGRSIYEWSVTPEMRDLEPGESIAFETQLTRPPAGAEGVRLTFTSG